MTFKQAYEYAMEHSRKFREHDAAVKAAAEKGEKTACLIFTVEPNATFYYGFDGVDLQKGRHTARRAATIMNRKEALIIL